MVAVITVMIVSFNFTSSISFGFSQKSVASASTAKASTNKMVALTFDDGPDSKYTEKVLNILNDNKIKGTFFVVGQNVKRYPSVIKRIAKEGHELGNHSWSHPNLSKLDQGKIRKEIRDTDKAITEVTGKTTTLMRPPYGATSATVKKEIQASGHVQALWNVDTRDWTRNSVAEIMKIVKSNSSNKITVLMHSGGGNRDHTIKALPQVINYYKSKGYAFVTMSELNGIQNNSKKEDTSTSNKDKNKDSVTTLHTTNPKSSNQKPNKVAIITADILNIRSGSGLEYPVVTKASHGTQVTILSSNKDWNYIKLPDGQLGWASAEYLQHKNDSNDTRQASSTGVETKGDYINNVVTVAKENDVSVSDLLSEVPPSTRTLILSTPRATVEQAKAWAMAKGASDVFINLADIVWEESIKAGVDPTVVYAQSAKETGFGKFGGVLNETFMNPAGLKISEGGEDFDQGAHQVFNNWESGVQAQIDHLALYAGASGYPKLDTTDPRHFNFLMGTATTVEELGGKWAPSFSYGTEIVSMMGEINKQN